MKYIDAEKLKAEIERLYEGEAPSHDQQCEFEDGYFTGIATISKFIGSLQQEQPILPGIEVPGIPGKDFIPVEWVDACEKYGKWKIVKVEQPEVDLEKEIDEHVIYMPHGEFASDNERQEDVEWAKKEFRHFYELGLKARKEG